MRVDTLTSIKVFRQVVESGSFVAAAERLDLSTAMVSKHIAYVEKRLGVRLLNRSSRAISLTEAGSVYFERAKATLDDLEATEVELGTLGTTPRGTLRITCPTWFARQLVADALAEFHQRYPEIVVDVSFEDRRVDLVEEGFDLALRVTHENALLPGLIARPVRPVPFFIAASRDYLRANGVPKTPADLAHHDFVADGNLLESVPFTGPKGKIEVPVRVVLRYRSTLGVAHAVAEGLGLGVVPDILFSEPMFKGVLAPILTDYPLREPTLYFVYISRRYLPLKIRAFIDFLMERKSKALVVALSERS